MKKSLLVTSALVSALALTLASCADAPSADPASSSGGSTSGGAAASDFKACMVSDSGGFDDKSFNQTSYAGLEKAKSDLGIQTGQVESTNAKDFATNIQSMIDAKCNMVVTVGFLLADATVASAKANPDVKFAIVDSQPEAAPDNLKPLVFNTAESSYLAGYLAAGMTTSGTVGTFGGLKIPTVTIFMDGFAQGVAKYNEDNSKSVKVLGWDAEKQDGQFVPGANPFDNVSGGKTTATNLVSQGADILFPVAGPAGQGALQVAQGSAGKVSAIWVDTDGYISAPQYKSVYLTSVYKGMDVAVFDAIKAAQDGSFSADTYVGTLANDGTGLAPYHDFESKVPDELKSKIDLLRQDIIDGKITIESKSQPK